MPRIKWILPFMALALIIPFPCYAQEWAITYGGIDDERAYVIQQTQDGGYIVAGASNSFGTGEYDCLVLKLNSDGTIAWQKTYGGSLNDYGYFIQQTFDQQGNPDGYIVIGDSNSFGQGDYDSWVLKLNLDGTVAWQKTYGGLSNDYAHSIRQTFDQQGNADGYIVAGDSDSPDGGDEIDSWVLKLNLDGTVAWQKTYGEVYIASAFRGYNSLQQTFDQQGNADGYIVAGWGQGSFWVLKLEPDGAIDWQKTYGLDTYVRAHCIQQTGDGGYIVAGWIRRYYPEQDDDCWVLKLKSDGTVDWQKSYAGSNYGGGYGRMDRAYSIQQTLDGGYVMAGFTFGFGADSCDTWVLKLNSDGTIHWQKMYGGHDPDRANCEITYSIEQTTNGGYIIAGSTGYGPINPHGDTDFWVLKLNANGEIPGCDAMGTTAAIVSDTSALVEDTSVVPQDLAAQSEDTYISSQDTEAERSVVCRFPPVCECDLVRLTSQNVSRGETLLFKATVTNNTDKAGTVLFGTRVTYPQGGQTGYIIGPTSVALNPYQSKSKEFWHTIPMWMPFGLHTYHGYVGNYGAGIYDECLFYFNVVQE